MTGVIYFVGAGPGDPELITAKGLQILKQADVVIYDRTIHAQILHHVGKAVERIEVGKVAHEEKDAQDKINRLLVQKAKKGKKVVRLISGDPFIFGKGGEEAKYLSSQQIPFEIIPGIPLAVAATAYAGIPITHDHFSTSFTVLKKLEKRNQENGGYIAKEAGTLLFFIKMRELPNLVEHLLQKGCLPTTPIALIQWGKTMQQQVVVGNLADIEGKIGKTSELPVIAVIGQVVRLRDQLHWLEKKPLFGKRVLITRALNQSKGFVEKIRALGGEPLVFPMVKMVPPQKKQQLDQALLQLDKFDWLIFTSVNGVTFFFKRMKEKQIDIRKLAHIKLAAVGPKTKRALEERGLFVDCMPNQHVAEALVEALRSVVSAGDKVLLPRANIARNVLPSELEKMGCQVEEVHAYDTLPAIENAEEVVRALREGSIHFITFTSSSTVRYFQRAIAKATHSWRTLLENVKIICIGPITAQTAKEIGFTVHAVADPYTIEGLVKAIQSSV